MAWDAAQWAQVVVPGISAALGGIVTAVVQQKVTASNARKVVRREKLEAIANRSAGAEKYAYAEQSRNTFMIQMLATTRQPGGVPPDTKLPDWVRVPEELPHITVELENLVQTFLPAQSDAVLGIRRLEGKLQLTFATILTEVLHSEPSALNGNEIATRCLTETLPIVDEIKRAHNALRKAASAEEKKYA